VHASLLAVALVSLGSPAQLEVSQAESMPVDLVSVEEMTQIQQGAKDAPKAEKSAPVPTTRPDIVANAQNAGNNTTDIEAPPTPTTKPNNNESAAAPPKQEKPAPVVDTKPNEVKDIVKEETSAPKPQETASLPIPKPEIATPPTPTQPPAQQQAQEPPPQNQEPAEIPVPPNVPRPNSRPQPPEPKPEPPKQAEQKPAETKPAEKPAEKKPDQAKSNEKPSDKKPADRKQETAKAAASQASEFNADEISALLNKQAPSGGGAKRSTETASLGGKKTIGTGLSASEIDSVRGQIQGNWNMPGGLTGVAEVRVVIRVSLDPSGNIVGQPEITATGGPEGTRRAVESSTRRALLRSAPLQNLPREKYDGEKGWNTLVLNFDPSDFAI
jgi:outer membrane biosynthesis protein TonB